MNLLKKVLHKLDGHHYPQDYLCLASESLDRPLRLYLVSDNRILYDVTRAHVFAGYHPLVFALHSTPFSLTGSINIVFTQNSFQPNEIFRQKDAIARLALQKIKEQPAVNNGLAYYEGCKGSHRFLPVFHQLICKWNNHLYHNKPGNVFLPGNLLQQVQVAYSVPRNISLITVGREQLYNLFPTDLHGPAGNHHYLISLRHEGKACSQVEQEGRLLLSQVDARAYQTVYALGKNHMKEYRGRNQFPFIDAVSETFQLPLPEDALGYKELELETSFIHGIHKLLLFKIVYSKQVAGAPATLSHVHNSYATWRYNNRLSGNYLLR